MANILYNEFTKRSQKMLTQPSPKDSFLKMEWTDIDMFIDPKTVKLPVNIKNDTNYYYKIESFVC